MNHVPDPVGAGRPDAPDVAAPSRERRIVDALVAAASALALGRDELDLLQEIAEACAEILAVSSAGILLADAQGTLQLMAASSDGLRHLELYQLQQDEGPCIDCYRSGRPVHVTDLDGAAQRWPRFVPGARAAHFASVDAVPLRFRDRTLGALGLFGTARGLIGVEDLRVAQALADVASSALVQSQGVADQDAVITQLQEALDSRVVLEQAKGILAQHAGLDMTGAFAALRVWARDHNERIRDVATRLTQRELSPDAVVENARRRRQPG